MDHDEFEILEVEEDFQAWEAYPQYRWVFNKLEVALRFGYHAGPAGVPVKRAGWYIVRPVYSIYGMGIGAKKVYLDPKRDTEAMTNHAHCAPGTFWCEWLEGSHLSVDYDRVDGKFVPRSCMLGAHGSSGDLVEFARWIKIKPSYSHWNLPDFIQDLEVPHLNLEMKDQNIFEIHMRLGNDPFDEYPIGTHIVPAWEGDNHTLYEKSPNWEFVGNWHDDLEKYKANGLINRARLGYYICTNINEEAAKNG